MDDMDEQNEENTIIFDLKYMKTKPDRITREHGIFHLKKLTKIKKFIFITHRNKIITSTLSYILSRVINRPFKVLKTIEDAYTFLDL